jgi:hypothetical protein
MAISGDSAPQFTTIAKFVRELGAEAAAIFARVLLVCDRLGLIGRQMFAIDGVKLPSNACKRCSGTHAELAREAQRMEAAAEKLRKVETLITADAGYHSEDNLRGLSERGVPALIADGLMRRRDTRFSNQARHKPKPDPLYDKRMPRPRQFQPKDLDFDPATGTCVCPEGKHLYSTGSACTTNGRKHRKFQGARRDCVPCELRKRCLRYPDRTATRQVAFLYKSNARGRCARPIRVCLGSSMIMTDRRP